MLDWVSWGKSKCLYNWEFFITKSGAKKTSRERFVKDRGWLPSNQLPRKKLKVFSPLKIIFFKTIDKITETY